MVEQCKSCKNKQIINGMIGCVYMDADCQNGEKYEAEIITNADRIRAMSDEELAEFLESTHTNMAIKLGSEYVVRAKDYIGIWLKHPAE